MCVLKVDNKDSMGVHSRPSIIESFIRSHESHPGQCAVVSAVISQQEVFRSLHLGSGLPGSSLRVLPVHAWVFSVGFLLQ